MRSTDKPPNLAILVSYSGHGGVEKVIDNLAPALAARGCAIDLLLIKAKGLDPARFPANVRLIRLRARHALTALPELVRYLQTQQPPVLMAVRHRAIKVAVLARALSRSRTRIVGQIHTTASVAMQNWNAIKRWRWRRETRRYYRRTELMVGVSQGVADDIQAMAGLPDGKTIAIHNPIITPELLETSQRPVSYPWLREDGHPLILGAGRLTRQKDFPTLIRGFALLPETLHARLLILGEGKDRPMLEKLITELGMTDRIALPGHVDDLPAWMRRADLFVLSSIWEGFGNVLVEAMAVGTPVVATDCPHGPREILQDGRLGPLVPIQTPQALAEAMAATLATPPAADQLQAALSGFTAEAAAQHYAQALQLDCATD